MRSQSRIRERDVVDAATRDSIKFDKDDRAAGNTGLTQYGVAHRAAGLAMVLTDPYHPNHTLACERLGLEPREL